MVKTKIEYHFWTNTDPYLRYIGRSVDVPLDPEFWKTQPDKVIGTAIGSYTYSEELDLSPGSHYVECRTSGYALPPYDQYKWFVRVLVNGKEVGSDSCGRDKAARFTFTVSETQANIPSTLILALIAVGGVLGIISYLLLRKK